MSPLSEVVQHLKPTTCSLNCIPSRLPKEVFNAVGSAVLRIINCSGSVPAASKHAVIQPLLKKPSLDPAVLLNVRPVSKLAFLSELLEKNVLIHMWKLRNTANRETILSVDVQQSFARVLS